LLRDKSLCLSWQYYCLQNPYIELFRGYGLAIES
jgi:hypothetical protein